MLVAVILAAGDSTRMGKPKALLPDPDGRPFVVRLARTFSTAGVDRIVIVTGALHAEIASVLAADAPAVETRCARNPDPARGQLSSFWVGLDAAGAEADGVLMIPVDIPLVRESTIRQVVDTWRRTQAPIVRPAVGQRHGHPVLFDRATFDALRRAPVNEGARAVVHAHADRVVNVLVDDEGCLVDVDTPAEYERMIGRNAHD